MTWGLVVAGVGAAVGGIAASSASKSAAKTQAQAAQDANATNLQMFNTQVGLNAPFRDTGLAANNRLAFLLGLQPGSTGAPSGPTPSFGGLSSQMLTQGSDGVFSPQQPAVESADAIRARLADQFTTNNGTHKEAFSIPGDNGNTTEIRDVPNGPTVNQQGLDAAVQAEIQRQQQAQAQQAQQAQQQAPANPVQPAGNNLSSFGSLAQPFGQADFAADGAPKVPAFDQAVPTAPQFGQFQDNTNLAGFEDMPAFNPDMLKEDPGYQFRLDQGMKGVNNSAAARGGLLSGAALKATDQYNQDYASGEYGNAFNRYQTTRGNKLQDYLTNQNTQQANRSNALSNYTTNLGTQQQNYQNQNTAYNTNLNQYSLNRANSLQDYSTAFDRFQTNRSNVINPLLSLSGAGQQATNQTSNAAQNYGAQSAAAVTGAGNATAAGQVGSANALGGAFSGASNAFQQNQLMNLLLQRQPTNLGAGVTPPNPYYNGQ